MMEFTELIHARIKRALVGAQHKGFMIDWLVDLIVIHIWFILLYDMLEIIS